jgi:hypothetical protein
MVMKLCALGACLLLAATVGAAVAQNAVRFPADGGAGHQDFDQGTPAPIAPTMPPGVSPPTRTTFEKIADSLSSLLSNGWGVAAYGDGAFILSNGQGKWIRCALISGGGGSTSLSLSKTAASICHRLN